MFPARIPANNWTLKSIVDGDYFYFCMPASLDMKNESSV